MNCSCLPVPHLSPLASPHSSNTLCLFPLPFASVVNGARVESISDGIINGLTRNQTADAPLLVIHALVGK